MSHGCRKICGAARVEVDTRSRACYGMPMVQGWRMMACLSDDIDWKVRSEGSHGKEGQDQ